MDLDDIFPLFVIAGIAAIVALGLAIKALVDARRANRQLADLIEKHFMFDHRLIRLAEQLQGGVPPTAAAPPAPVAAPAVETPPITAPAPEPESPPIAAAEPAQPVPVTPPAVPAPEPTWQPTPPIPARATPSRSWEQVLVEHWLVWLGGATLALGGAFLVKLSIDYGLLVPGVRVALGVMLGVGLCAGAEALRRREVTETEATSRPPSVIPQALAAAGSAIVFASIYAAYALYGMLPSGVAFILLAATAIATVAQSLRHGAFVAALGLIGAYVVPLLVSSEAPHALPLFSYLAIVTAASLALLRHRAWWWLGWLCLAGSIGWVLVWLGAATDPETPVVSAYLLILLGLFAAFRFGIERIGFLAGMAETPIVLVLTRCACWAIGFALFVMVHTDGFGHTSVAAAILATIGLMAMAYRDRELDDLIAVAGVLALTLLASWNLPLPKNEMDHWVFPVEPDRIAEFSIVAIIFALMLGGGSFALLPRVARPGRWAVLSAAIPPLVLAIAYWRLQKFEVDIAWSMAALALAAVELGAAASVAQRRNGEIEYEIALASYAVGVLASTIFAATLALSDAWLTVALALHLPAMGWIENRIRLPALRWLALGLAATAAIRLVLNPYVLSYPLGPTPIFNWLLYGYGVPAAAFIVATPQFGSRKDDALVWVLEAGSSLFLLALLTLELIHAAYGALWNPLDDFTLFSAAVALWIGFGTAMLALGERRDRPVLRWGGLLVAAIATVGTIGWQPVMLIFGVRVGNLMLFDALLLAEAVPAALYAVIAWLLRGRRVLPVIARLLSAAFGFMWITLEIQHAFHDKVELFASSSDAEWYSYSVAWLVCASAVLAVGLVRGNQWLRRAGLAGVALVVAKVFLSDMAELSGIWRALSFMGLGAALIGLGYAYRRLRPAETPPAASGSDPDGAAPAPSGT